MGRRRLPLSAPLLDASTRMRQLAAAEGGVITAAQCRALGVNDSAVRRLLDAGPWRRARRGVYADGAFTVQTPEPLIADPAHHAQCAALLAALLAGPDRARGRLTPERGAAARAAPPARAPRPTRRHHPTTTAPTNDPLRGDVHVLDYDDADVLDVAGVPVLAGARLVLDCCDVLPPDSALAVADAALACGLTSTARLSAALRCRRTRSRDAERAAELVVERADPLAANWFESMSRWWLLEAGLSRPRLQVPFTDGAGRVAKVDMLFGRVVGEADGAGKYDEPRALFAEKQREDWLRDLHRLEFVRWVPVEMRSPRGRAEVVARFARAAARLS
jgi:hypothetical protein